MCHGPGHGEVHRIPSPLRPLPVRVPSHLPVVAAARGAAGGGPGLIHPLLRSLGQTGKTSKAGTGTAAGTAVAVLWHTQRNRGGEWLSRAAAIGRWLETAVRVTQLMSLSFTGLQWDCSCLSNPSGHRAGSVARPLVRTACGHQGQQLPALEHKHPALPGRHAARLPLPGRVGWDEGQVGEGSIWARGIS